VIDRIGQLSQENPAEPTRLGRILAVCSVLIAVAGLCAGAVWADAGATPRIVLVPDKTPQSAIEIHGLSEFHLSEVQKISADDPSWPLRFGLYVANSGKVDAPPMLGSYAVVGRIVRFKPRFPLERGVEYRAVFHWFAAPGTPGNEIRLTQSFVVPAATAGPPTRVTAIFPSSAELPENLLRFYVQFSAPMSQGNSYGYVHLRDHKGTEVDRPFLELPQELWSPNGTRLTLLFEPGRIKHGLVPRLEEGTILSAGHNYTLTIDGKWPDAEGRPLKESVRKSFRAVAAEAGRPDPSGWKIESPAAGSRNPLVVRFPKPLDRAMLERVLRVCPLGAGRETVATLNEVAGAVAVADEEIRWSFTPHDAWSAGRYALVVSTILEDRAGNSIRLPFEVDLNRPQSARPSSAVVQIEFIVRGRP
jgi:hypothetical protein